jgi:hypothetical protein
VLRQPGLPHRQLRRPLRDEIARRRFARRAEPAEGHHTLDARRARGEHRILHRLELGRDDVAFLLGVVHEVDERARAARRRVEAAPLHQIGRDRLEPEVAELHGVKLAVDQRAHGRAGARPQVFEQGAPDEARRSADEDQLVTAPCAALDTSLAYFAKTPRR